MKRLENILKVVIVIVTLFTVTNSFAQVDSLETHTIKGKEYYIHIVEKGQSLYFIHKKYNAPLEVIKKENPSVADGLSIGEKVFIPVKKNVEYEVKTNGNYIHHTVKKQQTLYSIAKLYDIKQKEIIAANPELSGGLKEEQVIRIPVLNIKKEAAPKLIIEKKKYQTHTIGKGETLYSLSRLYKTTVDSIRLVNGGLKQGLKLGETIYIPLPVSPVMITDVTDTTLNVTAIGDLFENTILDTGLVERKKEYVIGLFLPFYLDANDEMVENRNVLDKKSIYPKSKFAIEFYNGVKMALDSITTDSCRFKLHVYDTNGDDSLRIQSLLLKPEVENLDLIIGPLFYNNFERVAKFAQIHQIPIVSPVKQSNKILLGNQFVFKAIPSKPTTIKEICTLVVDSFKTENLLAISHEASKEKSLVDLYIKAYNSQILSSEDTTIYSAIKKLNINTNIAEVVANLSPTKNNVIFVPTTNQTFVTKLFSALTTTLNGKKYKDYRVTLIGLEEWMGYENIDLPYFQKLNIHYSSARFIDREDSLTASFIKKYVGNRETYPSATTFLGFDLAYYFGTSFINQGTLFSQISLEKYIGLSISLNFFKTGVESGFENTNSYLLKFDDFTLIRTN